MLAATSITHSQESKRDSGRSTGCKAKAAVRANATCKEGKWLWRMLKVVASSNHGAAQPLTWRGGKAVSTGSNTKNTQANSNSASKVASSAHCAVQLSFTTHQNNSKGISKYSGAHCG